MTEQEIKAFMEKWELTSTEAAYILGISYPTLQKALAGARLGDLANRRMQKGRERFEASKAREGTLPPAA